MDEQGTIVITEPKAEETTGAAEKKQPETTIPQPKTFTETEIESMKKEWAKESKKQADEAAKKAEELAKLTDDEKRQKLLEDANSKVLEYEKKIKAQELANFTRAKLTELEVPESASKFIAGDDEETITNNANEFKTLFTKLVQDGVDKRFKDNGHTPQGGNSGFATQNKTLGDAVAAALKKK